jgi:hypothetical protein
MHSGGSTADCRQKLSAMSFCLSFHLPLLGPTGAHWLDDPQDLSCKDSIRQHAMDGWPLSCNSRLVRVPASSHNGRSQAVWSHISSRSLK